MRFVLALLLAACAVVPAAAQPANSAQTKPVQSNKPVQPSQPAPASQSSKPSSPEEIMRQRILLRERFNKGWDIQQETPQERERRCKNEAKKHYSAIHPFKRRKFVTNCIANGRR